MPVGRDALQARLHVAGRGEVAEDLEDREVDAAVLGDEEPAVGRERGAVRAAAGVGDHLPAAGSGQMRESVPSATLVQTRVPSADARSRRAPDRALAELGPEQMTCGPSIGRSSQISVAPAPEAAGTVGAQSVPTHERELP